MLLWPLILLLPLYTKAQDGGSLYLASLRASPRERPVYPLHLSTCLDGPLSFIPDLNQMRMHYMLMGLMNVSAIAERGKMIVEYFNEEFGTDFPTDANTVLNPNGTTCCGGAITMIPVVNNLNSAFFRVISMANLKTALKLNNQISAAGWNFVFNTDYQATGKVTSLIPANSLGLWHDNVIRLNDNAESYSKTHKKKDNSFPGSLFVWTVVGDPVIFPPSPYDGSLSINCRLMHKDLGEGQIRGLFVPEDPSNAGGIMHGREVLSWPSTLPATLPSIY